MFLRVENRQVVLSLLGNLRYRNNAHIDSIVIVDWCFLPHHCIAIQQIIEVERAHDFDYGSSLF